MISLTFHFFELQLRFFYVGFSAACTFLLTYVFRIEMLYLIGKPFLELNQTFVFLDLTEAFSSFLRISSFLSCLILCPFLLYHLWCFFIPSLYVTERHRFTLPCFFVFFLLLVEFFLIYFLLLPSICSFLVSFQLTPGMTEAGVLKNSLITVEFTARLESYVSLIMKIFSSLFLFFQIPVGICFLYSQKLLDVSTLSSQRKVLSLCSLLFSACVVPPDLGSQLLVAFFIYFLCEFLIFLGFFFE